jgi:thiol-disulfide isomerase/thioredoxin
MPSKAFSFQTLPQEGVCGTESETSTECNDLQTKPDDVSTLFTGSAGEKGPEAFSKQKSRHPQKELESEVGKPPSGDIEFVVHFFWGKGCPHCEEEKLFLDEMRKKYPTMKVIDYEVWYDKENAAFLVSMARAYDMKTSGVPVTFIGENVFIGFSKHSREELAASVIQCLSVECIDPALVASGKISLEGTKKLLKPGETSERADDLECTEKTRTVYIPWIGNLDASETSLPVMTLVIAGMDSFNPCAFFVLFSLLGLLIHAQSRKKMLLIGSEFVFFSGFIYFLFMAAWLNLFLFMGQVALITTIAGTVAVIIAVINIKDFFAFKKGVSLSIPDSAKPKLFDRMRKLMKSTSLFSILAGTAILAIAANSYELLCTAGFPLVYTRILTLHNLSNLSYYLYLIFYNAVYVIPLLIIVIVFTVTLGRKTLSEQQGRILKLVSGTMMLGLGGVLIVNPEVLNNTVISFLLLMGALSVSALVVSVTRKLKCFQ